MPTKDERIKTLRRKRGIVKGAISKVTNLLDDLTNQSEGTIEAAVEHMRKSFETFDVIQEELEELDEDNELPQRDTVLDMFLNANGRAIVYMRERAISAGRQSVKSSASTEPEPSASDLSPRVMLPKVDVPKFDGTIESWASFYDLFTEFVDKNSAIKTNAAKLYYLRKAMTGNATKLLDDISTISDNYQIAFDRLKSKFHSPRRALRAHWTKLREYPKLQRDTPISLGQLVDTFEQHLRAMKNLEAPINQWSVPLIDLILTKISAHTAWQWELTLDDADNEMPNYTHLLKFLEKRANSVALSNYEPGAKTAHKNSNQFKGNNSAPTSSVKSTAYNYSTKASSSNKQVKRKKCPVCSEEHPIYLCEKFKVMSLENKIKVVERESLCKKCLGKHKQECKSKYQCRICKDSTHHTLLCSSENVEGLQKSKNFVGLVNSPTSKLITTAVVDAVNPDGKSVGCRALIDTCSTTHFMTLNLTQKLGLKINKDSTPVSVLNSITTSSRGTVTAQIRSRCSGYTRKLTFRVVEAIASMVPDQPVQSRKIKIPKNIKLADPEFYRPAPAEILVASGVALSLLCQGQINLSDPGGQELYLQKTLLGWVIGGSAPSEGPSSTASCHLATLESTLKRFWEIEEIPPTDVTIKCKNEDEARCEEHFLNNVSRNSEGRYLVALPFNEKKANLGESRSMAEKRLAGLTRKLTRNPELREKYGAVMQEYLDLGHMEPVEVVEGGEGCYLPHHAVLKQSSLTTSVRVVFDGSARTNSGLSLNDTLRVGPTIQPDLFSQLLRFRIHNIVLTGDIEKMYRQILVKPQDRKFQRILWPDDKGNVQTYELNTVTFGLAPSSFLAIRSVHQLAEDEKHNFPLAARVLKEDFYVDNALTGSPDVDAAIQLREQLAGALEKGGMNIYQWASNAPEVLEGLSPESINKQLILSNSTVNTLGLKWDANNDSITYTVANMALNPVVTKRSVLSEISKIFDPLGLLAPVIIFAKILIQDMWKLQLHWDESLTSSLRQSWLKYRGQLPLLDDLSFSRKILIDDPVCIELHGFGDAGTNAYGCCLYVRSADKFGNIQTNLLCAKSRVAPIKTISVPRLELCAASLLANLSTNVVDQVPISFDKVCYWTDSTVVLNWLHTYPSSLQVFVANRVAEIQTKTDVNSWSYVRSADNPADMITRSLMPRNFLKTSIWQRGPTWLSQPENEWPVSKFEYEPENVPEMKRIQCFAVSVIDTVILEKYSCIFKLQRMVALFWRMKNKNKHDDTLSGKKRELKIKNAGVTVKELDSALKIILKIVQNNAFGEDINSLIKGKPLPSRSDLLPLNPFVDKDGLVRVGGRLKNADLPFSQRHPVILPKSNHVTRLLIEAEHVAHAHAGVQATLYALRRRFWLLDGRNSVRKILRKCVTCAKVKPPSVDYLMGDLPADRVIQARPFSRAGMDLCGYFFLKEKKYRNRNQVKAYVVIFVTKAVHLELVTDLTSDAFISALRRFMARRGFCSDIYSDNGTNFVGANNEMKELLALFSDPQHQSEVSAFAAKHNVRWHFIPGKSPHIGGLWESAVKSFKHHLRRVVKGALFTYEEFYTFCVEIEAILNSRPISPMSSDPNDLFSPNSWPFPDWRIPNKLT